MNDNVRISVCMATYNGEKFIKKQLESILVQLDENDEVIISDDLSTDNTLRIVEQFNDSRIKVYLHKENHGFTQNFENALKMAKGKYIFLSDQDDEWIENKVKLMLKELEKYDFVVSDCITIDENGTIIDQSRFKKFNIKKGFFRVMMKMRYLGCCMAFKNIILKTALPFPKRVELVEHDTWIASVAEMYYSVKLINRPLIYYRRHKNNASSGGFDRGNSLLNKIIRRIYRFIELIKVCFRGKVKKCSRK